MEHHTKIFNDFIREYIRNHSPFQLKDQVRVTTFHSNKEYEITKIVVDSMGEFNYEVTSPRTHSTLPSLFSAKSIERAAGK